MIPYFSVFFFWGILFMQKAALSPETPSEMLKCPAPPLFPFAQQADPFFAFQLISDEFSFSLTYGIWSGGEFLFFVCTFQFPDTGCGP